MEYLQYVYVLVILGGVFALAYFIGRSKGKKESSNIIERQKISLNGQITEVEEELATMYLKNEELRTKLSLSEDNLAIERDALKQSQSDAKVIAKSLTIERNRVFSAKALNKKIQDKLDDLVGDTAHLMDEAVDKAEEIIDDIKEVVKKPVKKKRKYTRRKK